MPAIVVGIVGENKRQTSHLARKGVDFIAGEAMDQKIVHLLVRPIDGKEIAEVSQRRNQEYAGTRKGFIQITGIVPVQIEPGDSILGNLPERTVCAKKLATLRRNECILINKSQVVRRDV
jgi:hypothetical protein